MPQNEYNTYTPLKRTIPQSAPQPAYEEPEEPVQASEAPALRRQAARQQAVETYKQQQLERNPFAYSGALQASLPEANLRLAEQQAEQDFQESQQIQRRAEIDRRRAEQQATSVAQKTRNAALEAQYRGTGQQFYTDAFGNVAPVIEAATGRPLYTKTAPSLSKHPKTGEPALEWRDQYGQRQFKRPKMTASDDPMDDRLYYDIGDGESMPAMTIEQAIAHPDVQVRKMGIAARSRKMRASRDQAVATKMAEADTADVEYNDAVAIGQASRMRAEQLAAAGGSPDEINAAITEAMELERRTNPQTGDLAIRRNIARRSLATERIRAKLDAHLLARDQIAARAAAGDKTVDPAENERAIKAYEAELGRSEEAEKKLGALMQPVAVPATPAAAPQGDGFTQGLKSAARGATAEGIYAMGEGLARMLERFGPGPVAKGAKWYADATREFRDTIRRALPVDQKFAESLTGQLSQGAGQLAGNVVTGVAGRQPGIALASLGQIYDEAFQDAKRAGADDATAHSAATKYLPAAAVDYLADRLVIGKLLKPLVGKMTVGRFVKDILKAGAAEGATEGAQQAYLNAVAAKLEGYDPNRPLDKEVLDSVIVGSVLGGGATGIGSARGFAQDAQGAQPQPPVIPTAPAAGPQPTNFPTADRLEYDVPVRPLSAEELALEQQLAQPPAPPATAPTETLPVPPAAEAPVAATTAEPPAVEPQQAKASDAQTAKGAAVVEAIATPGVRYQYTVFRPGQGLPEAVQVDVIAPDGSRSLVSSNPEELRAAGVNIPDVPASVPQGQYSLEQIQEASRPAVQTAVAPSSYTLRAPRRLEESLATPKDILEYRKERIENYRNALKEEIGLSDEQADRLASILRRAGDTGKFERSLTPEQQARLDAFFEGPMNQRGGPLEQWDESSRYIEDIAASDDKEYLADFVVGSLGRIGDLPKFEASDRFITPILALNRLREIGGSWIDVDSALRAKIKRMQAGDDSAELYRAYGSSIKKFASEYGVDLSIDPIGANAAIKGEPANAIQIQSPAAIPVQPAPEAGEGVRSGDQIVQPASGASQAAPVVQQEVTPQQARAERVAQMRKQRRASVTDQAAIEAAAAAQAAPASPAPRTIESIREARAATPTVTDLPPPAAMKREALRAELESAGITKTPKGVPIADANPAQLMDAVGKLRRGELTAEGVKPGAEAAASGDVVERLQKAKRLPKRLKSGEVMTLGPDTIYDAAHDAALDIAIVAVKAGRVIKEAVKLAMDRFRAMHPKATDAEVAQARASIEAALQGPPPETPTEGQNPSPVQPAPSGQTFTGPVSPGTPEFRKRSKSALGEYEYVSTTNRGQEKYAQEFADWHEKNGTPESAVAEMRSINEPAMRAAVAAELLGRTMQKWESASVAEKAELQARVASLMGDVKAEKTEAGQALQAQAMVNKKLAPYAPLLSWMDLLRQRYDVEVAPKVGEDTGAKVKKGIKDAGDEASDDLKAALESEDGKKPSAKNPAALDEWLKNHGPILRLLRNAAKARGLAWKDIFTDLPENQEARRAELFDRVKAEPKLKDLTEAQQRLLAERLDESWTYLRNQIFRQEFSRLVPLPGIRDADVKKVRSVVGDLIKFSNLGILNNETFLSAVADKYGLERLDGATAKKLTELAAKLQNAKNDSERAKASLEMYEAVSKARGISPGEAVMGAFYSNLLNSLVTTVYAMGGGNLVNTVWNLGTLAISPAAESKGGRLKKVRELAPALARGYKTGIPEGLNQALSILTTGHGGEDAAAQLVEARGEPLELIAKGGVWEEWEKANPRKAKTVQMAADVAKMVPRLARAIDAMFYYPSKQAALRFITEQSLMAQYANPQERAKKAAELLKVTPADFIAAEKKAKDEGFDGIDMSLRIADILAPKSALFRIQKSAPAVRYAGERRRAAQEESLGEALMKEGTRFGQKTTLSQEPEGWAGVFYDNFSRTVENVRPRDFPILKVFFPFLRLPTNFYNANLAATPFGVASAAIGSTPTMRKVAGKRVRRQLSQNEMNQLYAQSLIGALSMLYFTARAVNADPDDEDAFDITANGPADKALRRQMEQAGWKPHSIRIPGTRTWVDYMNTPMAMPLSMAGHITDAYRYAKQKDELALGNALTDAAVRFPSVVFGLPALSGMQQLSEMLDDEKVNAKGVTDFLTRTAKNFVRPRLIEEVGRIFDPAVRDDGVIRYDELGEPVKRSPLSRIAKTESEDPLRQVLLRRKLKIPAAGRDTTLNNKPMTPEQYSEYMRISGSAIKKQLDSIVPLLQRLPREQAQDYLNNITNRERARARQELALAALRQPQ